jgi:histidinol dehydrogenase
MELSRKFDDFEGDTVLLSKDEIEQQLKDAEKAGRLTQLNKDDIAFQLERVRNFAQAQKDSHKEFEVELFPGVRGKLLLLKEWYTVVSTK